MKIHYLRKCHHLKVSPSYFVIFCLRISLSIASLELRNLDSSRSSLSREFSCSRNAARRAIWFSLSLLASRDLETRQSNMIYTSSTGCPKKVLLRKMSICPLNHYLFAAILFFILFTQYCSSFESFVTNIFGLFLMIGCGLSSSGWNSLFLGSNSAPGSVASYAWENWWV